MFAKGNGHVQQTQLCPPPAFCPTLSLANIPEPLSELRFHWNSCVCFCGWQTNTTAQTQSQLGVCWANSHTFWLGSLCFFFFFKKNPHREPQMPISSSNQFHFQSAYCCGFSLRFIECCCHEDWSTNTQSCSFSPQVPWKFVNLSWPSSGTPAGYNNI